MIDIDLAVVVAFSQ